MRVDLAGIVAMYARHDGLPAAFTAARDGIDVVLRDRGWRRTTPEDTAQALLRGARAGQAIAGPDGGAEQAALRVSTVLLGLVGAFRVEPLQALARLHAVAAAEHTDGERGRPRDADAARRLQRLARILVDPAPAPALLVAAVAHAEIAACTVFGSHDRIVGLAAERLTLVSRGVDRASVLVPEAAHLARSASYEQALAAYRAVGGLDALAVGDSAAEAALAQWMRHAAEAYAGSVAASPVQANGARTDPGAAAHT